MIHSRPASALALLLLGGLGACRCGEGTGPRAYDVGVPLADLPRAQPASLAAAVPGKVLLFAEAQDGRTLLHAIEASAWFGALQKSGGDRGLALSGPAATLTALVQRLNDLSRSPIGDEALADLLDGPLGIAVRPNSRGGFDLLALKAVSTKAAGALRLAQMLEAVHPSASAVRVERHQGLPVRALRVDGAHQLYYVVLRDRLLLATDVAWLKAALDVALAQRPAVEQPSVHAVESESSNAQGFAVLDADVAFQNPTLGTAGRALAGLAWVGLRWNEAGAELGVRRASGRFGPPGPSWGLPPGSVLALEREAPLAELLAVPPPSVLDAGAADGGSPVDAGPPDPHELAGRALLKQVEAALSPSMEGHLVYALSREPEHGPEHLLALTTRGPGAALAFDALASSVFRAPATRHDEISPGAHCVGTPAALCWAEVGPLLALATSAAEIHAEGEAMRGPHSLPGGPFTVFLDPAEFIALLGHSAAPAPRKKGATSPGELEPLVSALRTEGPLLAHLSAPPDSAEAWGPVTISARPIEPRREPRDGGAP